MGVISGALLYPGFATAEVDLNDGGVWVTNNNTGMVGHLNYQSRLLDGGYAANSDSFDIIQDQATVFNINSDQSKVSPVDVANVVRGTEVQLPGSAAVAMRRCLLGRVPGAVAPFLSGPLLPLPPLPPWSGARTR